MTLGRRREEWRRSTTYQEHGDLVKNVNDFAGSLTLVVGLGGHRESKGRGGTKQTKQYRK